MKKKTTMTVLDSHMLAQDIWSLELAYARRIFRTRSVPGSSPDCIPQEEI